MADVKWIKITTDIFDDEKIKIIDTMPARDEILVIWFKLLALTGRSNQGGLLKISNKMPYTNKMLSAVFNRSLDIVQLSLGIFQNYGMIEIEENETILITNWDKHQNIEGLDKIREQNKNRQQIARDKKKQLRIEDSHVTDNVTVTENNATELDKELDKEKDIYTKPKNEKTCTYTKDFEEWYCSYPNQFNKAQTFKNWKSTLKTDTKENIVIATKEYKAYIKKNKIEANYIVRSTNFVGQKQEYQGYIKEISTIIKPKMEIEVKNYG